MADRVDTGTRRSVTVRRVAGDLALAVIVAVAFLVVLNGGVPR